MSLLTTPHLYGGKTFDAVFVISPSVHLDSTWAHLKKYREKNFGQKPEQFFFDTWDGPKVQALIDESFKLTEYHKKARHTPSTSVLLVVDDMADQQSILHAQGNSILNSAFIRARHAYLSVWIASQRPNLVSSIIRTQMSALFIFRQRNVKDLITFLDECSAAVDRRVLMTMHQEATREKHSFMLVNLMADDAEHMFYWGLDRRLIPALEDESP